MALLTKGTQFYFVNPATNAVVELYCVKTLDPGGAQRGQIETTCLNAQSRSYLPGLPTPGQATLTIDFDPRQPSHVLFHDLYLTGETLHFAVGWSDGTASPTVNSAGDFVFPATRSWLSFDGFIQNCPFNFQVDQTVQSSVQIQVSDFPDFLAKTP